MVMDVHGRDLRYFVAVAEELHFTRAADRLFVSQPALSKQIGMLERQLGARLFERGRDGVRLTPVGTALLPHARLVLAEWDRAWEAAGQAKASQRATLAVGMSTSPGRGGLLPAIRSRFTAARPQATVNLRQVSWGDPTAGLADGSSDVAFVWLPVPEPGRFRWIVVADEPRLVAMAGTHPLASREVVPFAELLNEPFLALPQSAGPLRRRGGAPGQGYLTQPAGTGLAGHRPPPARAGLRTRVPAGHLAQRPDACVAGQPVTPGRSPRSSDAFGDRQYGELARTRQD